ncbi:hypothetical protein EZS27_036755, partial [termite gut metagenome]
MLLFYVPDILTKNELPEEETQHCIRVLRLSQGDEICITDGKGFFYPAIIDTLSGKRCKVVVKEAIRQELFLLYLHLSPWGLYGQQSSFVCLRLIRVRGENLFR